MIDLTPLDVRKKRGDFRRILRGYDPEEVDIFLALVEERLEELVRENLTLSEKAGRLEVSVRALEEREKAVQEALVTAQKLREDVQDQSRREVDLLKKEARAEVEVLRREVDREVERRLMEAEGLIRERQHALEELERNRRKFLKAFRSLLERELDAVEVEEARKPLDDAPLELRLKGWTPALSATPEDGPLVEEEGAEAEAEGPEEVEEEAEAEAEAEGPEEVEEEAEAEAPEEVEEREGGEPLWLSSLLKQEDRKPRGEEEG